MKDQTEKIRLRAKENSINREKEVLKTIIEMKKNGDKITFYSVQKKTKAAKSYLYKNETIFNTINAHRILQNKNKRTDESKDVIISSLRLKISRLEKQFNEIEKINSDSYKNKCEKLLVENIELKEQLKNAYHY